SRAINAFKTASVLEPRNARFHYVYGLSLEATQLQQAQKEIRKAYQLSASPQYLYALCEIKIRHRVFDASKCINELRPLIPEKNIDTLEAQLKALKE
ncbi:MAG: deca-heme c-type cytochrome, partial [Aestuariibacter sp.]|nr:deca-heme c-type cytochrome [Aestuariibacter sp.]